MRYECERLTINGRDAFRTKKLDRQKMETTKLLHKVLQREDNRNWNLNLNQLP